MQRHSYSQPDHGAFASSLRKRRGVPVNLADRYEDLYEFEPLPDPVGPKKRIGLTLPRNYKPTAASCSLRKRSKSKWVSVGSDMGYSKRKMRSTFSDIGDQEHLLRYPMGEDEEDEEDEESSFPKISTQQRMKIGFALLMIPSLMVILYGQKKFKSDSNVVGDISSLGAAGFGGLGGGGGGLGMHGAGGGMGGFPDDMDLKSRFGGRYPGHDEEDGTDVPEGEDHDDDGPPLDPRNEYEELIKKARGDSGHGLPIDLIPPIAAPIPPVPEEALDDTFADGGDGITGSTSDTMEVTLSPETTSKDPDEEDYLVKDGEVPEDRFGMEPLLGLRETEAAEDKPRGNPDPELEVEQETLHPDLLASIEADKLSDFEEDDPEVDEAEKAEGEASGSDLLSPLELKDSGYKVILVWTPSFEKVNPTLPEGSKSFKKCPSNRCVVTTDRRYLTISDAIVFNGRDLMMHDLPPQRTPQQNWILHFTEPSSSPYFQGLNYFHGLFNWTWSYRKDSTLVQSAGRFRPIRKEQLQNNILFSSRFFDIWRNKRRMVLWMAEGCKSDSRRETFVEELKKYIDVDVYGSCGQKDSGCPKTGDDVADELCLRQLTKNYLFIVAFEEALCPDFVTYPMFEYLRHNVVPIVMGSANYSTLTPPNSVINSLQFASPNLLADYLNHVGTDYNKYKAYLEWKRHFQVVLRPRVLCKICSTLNDEGTADESAVGRDIASWWTNKSQCKQWTEVVPKAGVKLVTP